MWIRRTVLTQKYFTIVEHKLIEEAIRKAYDASS